MPSPLCGNGNGERGGDGSFGAAETECVCGEWFLRDKRVGKNNTIFFHHKTILT